MDEMHDELLEREIFYTLTEAEQLIETRKWEHPKSGRRNHIRLRSSPGYKPPAPWITVQAGD
jgi:hypothetical protein